jgi:hypothetical protein
MKKTYREWTKIALSDAIKGVFYISGDEKLVELLVDPIMNCPDIKLKNTTEDLMTKSEFFEMVRESLK